jgi:integrase
MRVPANGRCAGRERRSQRARLFDRKGDARRFEADLNRRRQLGALATTPRSRITLAEFMDEDWWPRHAIPNLAEDTRRRYLEIWRTHLEHRVGGVEVQAFTPLIVEDLRDGMLKADVPLATQRKTLMLLQGILRRAVLRGLIPANPVQVVTKPRQPPAPPPRPLPPEMVERIRLQMLTAWASSGRGTGRSREELEWWRHRNAIMVSLLAYGGLRPAEDRAARWEDVDGRTLHVVASKTGRARDIELLEPLARDLEEWLAIAGSRNGSGLIFPTMDGDAWKRQDWQNWRRRVYQPAATAAGVTGDLRPYRLRGSFVSLLLWEGHSLAYVAEQAGHSIATLAKHYAGVIRELEASPRKPAAEAIAEAREAVFNSGQ